VAKIKEIAVTIDKSDPVKFRDLLMQCASTSMSSKLIHSQTPFFANMVVDAVLSLDQVDLDESLIGVKKVPGGGMQDSLLIRGVAFKKTFSYAGFEQQPKSFKDPKVLCLNVELELKAEKDNAEVRVNQVSEYQAIVDAEWSIIYRKLEAIVATGAKVVLSKLPIGDLATCIVVSPCLLYTTPHTISPTDVLRIRATMRPYKPLRRQQMVSRKKQKSKGRCRSDTLVG